MKNSKYFTSLEKKKSESKVISRLNVNGNIITEKREILSEQKHHYENLYSKIESSFDENISKLNENDQINCDGLISDHECIKALKDMKNNKSSGSDGITAEFTKQIGQI